MKKILIIEDEVIVRENLVEILMNEGFETIYAQDGEEGYYMAITSEPDLILSDIRMPGLNGFDLLKKLQTNYSTAFVPFIFLTARTDVEDLRKGMSLGADDYIIKPFRVNELLKAIKIRLQKSENFLSTNKEFKEVLLKKIPHELLTPLVSVLGISELLIDDLEKYSSNEIKEMIKKIQWSGKRLLRRIEKFLSYVELSNQNQNENLDVKANYHEYEIDSDYIKANIISKAKDFGRENNIQFEIRNSKLNIIPCHFETLIYELLENSMKYSPQNSLIMVTGDIENRTYILRIKNNLIKNIRMDINKIRIFNHFDNLNFSIEGLGVGLSIVKKIIESYKGYLKINTSPLNVTVEAGIPLDQAY